MAKLENQFRNILLKKINYTIWDDNRKLNIKRLIKILLKEI